MLIWDIAASISRARMQKARPKTMGDYMTKAQRLSVLSYAKRAAVASIITAATVAAPAYAQDNAPAYAQDKKAAGPLALEKIESFFVSGSKVYSKYTGPSGSPIGSEGEITIGQMYVQAWIPAKRNMKLPAIVMLHGSTHSGATYETTPDGREGWAHFFARRGVPVYIVDQPGRGRSGFDHTAIIEAKETGKLDILPSPSAFAHNTAWEEFRFGNELNKPFKKSRFPFKAINRYWKQLIPSVEGPGAVPGLVKLLDKIGPAVLMGHSAGGQPVISAAIERPKLVKAVVNLEAPFGCAIDEAAIEKAYKTVPLLSVYGDVGEAYNPAQLWKDFWYAAVNSCDKASTRINKAGGTARTIYLPKIGILGNSHMFMMDDNSDSIAEIIYKWLMKEMQVNNHKLALEAR
jgi:pimeloyl-ACP methyl ester carboxylesterase